MLAAKSIKTSAFGQRVQSRATNGSRYVMRAGNWLPGSTAPSYIPDNMAG